MATDYETYYRDNRHGLGEPTREFVAFFNDYPDKPCEVLDIGCGQGRDALFIARLGHNVTAIDFSPTGIQDLENDALAEGLSINAIVADVRNYQWTGTFDVIVIDRTLHMLSVKEQTRVLQNLLLSVTKKGSHVLIADEPSNLPALAAVFDNSQSPWATTLSRGGFLFMASSWPLHEPAIAAATCSVETVSSVLQQCAATYQSANIRPIICISSSSLNGLRRNSSAPKVIRYRFASTTEFAPLIPDTPSILVFLRSKAPIFPRNDTPPSGTGLPSSYTMKPTTQRSLSTHHSWL